MAIKKIRFSKIVIVVFLAVLIWVWADLAQDARLPVTNVTISLAKNTDPTLWASFKTDTADAKLSASIDSVTLKGPASRIAEAERLRNAGSLDLGAFLVPETEDMNSPGDHPLDVLSFLRQSEKIRRLGLKVESCQPKTFVVQVVKLTQKPLPVECIDESGGSLNPASVEPVKVTAFVPPDGTFTAKVQLTAADIDQARVAPVKKIPYVELAPGQTRPVAASVNIRMPPAQDTLREHTITTATLSFCLSEVMQGKFKIEVLNPTDMATVLIRATPAARQAYEQQPFQLLLFILDEDRKATTELRRPVVFNFPEDFVRRGEIAPAQQPAQARFKLVPISTEATTPPGPSDKKS
jgi:hypothetical protein